MQLKLELHHPRCI